MEILAKSNPEIFLKTHIDDGLEIVKLLEISFPRVNKILGDKFWEKLKIAVISHDLGKAHVEFQLLLRRNNNNWNNHRHELFSFPFISSFNLDEDIKKLVGLAVLGHHKDFNSLEKLLDEFYFCDDDEELLEMLDEEPESFNKDFTQNLGIKQIEKLLGVYGIKLKDSIVDNPSSLISKYLLNPLNISEKDGLTLLLLLGALKHCDHLSSAKIKSINKLDAKSFIFLDNLRFKIQKINCDFYNHQIEASKVVGNIILIAPTGSGKTEASMLWLRKQYRDIGQGRVFYCLPFTASINAMFIRLKKDIGDNNIGLLHGKLNEYLNNYFQDLQYNALVKKDSISALKELYKTIVPPLKVLTPFQFLKNLFGLKHFEKGIFEWIGGYFIFDEIHAYDSKTFAQIIVFLEFITKRLEAKVMIMTATLPIFMKSRISKAIGDYIEVKADKSLFESFTRHRIILKNGVIEENIELIKSHIMCRKKVLVVCNTVNQAQTIFKVLHSYCKNSLLLHSYFNGNDRFRIENTLLKEKVDLLVGTQSIEVSLDIDYDIIFTELAPLDALLQRFGRVNRKRGKGICDCIVFKERNKSDKYIYKDENVINRTLLVLETICLDEDGILSEQKTQEYIDFVYPSWNAELENDFNEIYSLLSKEVNNLTPLVKVGIREEEFYKQFDGISILPVSLEGEYKNHLKVFDFIAAESLMVKIKSNLFAAWINPTNDNIRQSIYTLDNNKSSLVRYYITNKVYDEKLGLLKKESDDWSKFIKAEFI